MEEFLVEERLIIISNLHDYSKQLVVTTQALHQEPNVSCHASLIPRRESSFILANL
jgi:hypothetical protein